MNFTWRGLGVFTCCLLMAQTSVLYAEAADDILRVGIRTDAKPFVYEKDGKLEGFLFKMCDFAFKRSGLEFTYVPVKAGDRIDWLGDGNKIDALCDPFTMTRERARAFLFSPVVFVSGGSFLYYERTSDESYLAARGRVGNMETVIGHNGQKLKKGYGGVYVQASDGEAVPRQRQPLACDSLKPGQIGTVRIGVIKGSTALAIVENALALEEPVVAAYAYETICYTEFDNHEEGITALCSRAGAAEGEAISYYFGDRDIIVAYLEGLKEDVKPCAHVSAGGEDEITVSDRFFSSEPYGIAFSPRVDLAKVVKFQAALLDTFSELETDPDDPSVVTTKPFQWFKKYFPNKRPSQPVRSAFSTLILPQK